MSFFRICLETSLAIQHRLYLLSPLIEHRRLHFAFSFVLCSRKLDAQPIQNLYSPLGTARFSVSPSRLLFQVTLFALHREVWESVKFVEEREGLEPS